jgi:hypothetical protein
MAAVRVALILGCAADTETRYVLPILLVDRVAGETQSVRW